MKRFTLSIVLVILVDLVFSQIAPLSLSSDFSGNGNGKGNQKVSSLPKGDVIWSEDFNQSKWISTVTEGSTGGYLANGSALPEGWSVYDGNNLDFVWHWSNVGPRGKFTSIASGGPLYPDERYIDGTFEMPEGNTLSNGFMMLESDFYNTTEPGDMVLDLISMDSYLQFGPVDLSGNPYVLLEFNQLFRYCCQSSNILGVYVSNDYDPEAPDSAVWTLYDTKGGTPSSSFCFVNARHVSINVSSSAGNYSNVYFRLYHGGSSASHYFWLIDDMRITEPLVSDLAVEDSWIEYIDTTHMDDSWSDEVKSFAFSGGYTHIPEVVVDTFVAFRARVVNNGSSVQTANLKVNVEKDGVILFNGQSDAQTLSNGQSTDLNLYSSFAPSGQGSYQVSATVQTDSVDQNPANNRFSYRFEVDDNLYSRVYQENTSKFTTGGPTDWFDGGTDGDRVVQLFQIPGGAQPVTLSGIRFYFPSYRTSNYSSELAAIQNNKYSVVARAYYSDETGFPSDAFLTSDVRHLTINDTSSGVYVPFVSDGNQVVGSGDYWVGIECYNGNTGPDSTNHLRFEIGTDDNGPKQPNHGGLAYLAYDSSWFNSPDNYAIDLFVNAMPSNQINLTFNADMSHVENFDVKNDSLFVTGSFCSWVTPGIEGSIKLTDSDHDSIYSATIQVDQNQQIQYKYCKNYSWDGEEWPGGLNRIINVYSTDFQTHDYFGIQDPDAKIISFKVENQIGEESISDEGYMGSIHVFVDKGTDLTSLTPTIEINDGASINPPSGVAQDFSDSVLYEVSGISGINKSYCVHVSFFLSNDATLSSMSIDLFPNPTPGNLTIDTKQVYKSLEVIVFNAMGQKVYTQKFENSQVLDLNLAQLPKGVYSVKLLAENKTAIYHVILK